MGVYPIGYYSHNVHFVLASAQLLGERETVLEQADKLDKWLSNDVASAIPITQPVKAAPYYAWAQYAEPDMVLALPDPPGAPPYVKAMWHYACGTALAAKKDPAAARAEADAIRKILAETDWSTLDLWGIPARPVLEVAGVRDILTKSQGSANVLNVVQATFDALEQLKSPQVEAARRGKKVSVVSTLTTQPPMIADELRRQADHFIDLAGMRNQVGRDPSERVQRQSERTQAANFGDEFEDDDTD